MTTRLDLAATNAYRRRTRRLIARSSVALVAIWNRTPDTGEAAEAEFGEQVRPILAAFGTVAASLSAGYLGTLVGERPPIDGLTIEQDLRHPFIGLYRDLSRGVPFEQARATASTRAASLGQERIIRTQRTVDDIADQSATITGWRRVPQGSTCDWCIGASQAWYETASDASFGHVHGGVDYCDCDVVPIVGRRDPGQVLNRPLADVKRDEPYIDADTGKATARPEPAASSPAP